MKSIETKHKYIAAVDHALATTPDRKPGDKDVALPLSSLEGNSIGFRFLKAHPDGSFDLNELPRFAKIPRGIRRHVGPLQFHAVLYEVRETWERYSLSFDQFVQYGRPEKIDVTETTSIIPHVEEATEEPAPISGPVNFLGAIDNITKRIKDVGS